MSIPGIELSVFRCPVNLEWTYRPATQVTDSVLDDLLGGVTQEHARLGEVLIDTGVAVVGIHGGVEEVCSPAASKKCCDKRYAAPHVYYAFDSIP